MKRGVGNSAEIGKSLQKWQVNRQHDSNKPRRATAQKKLKEEEEEI